MTSEARHINPPQKAKPRRLSLSFGHDQRPFSRKGVVLFILFTFCCLLPASTGNVSAATLAANPSPGPIAPAQPEDIPILLQKLLNPNPQVRAAASRSLGTIPPEVKIPALIQSLSDSNWKIQVLAAFHLGQMGTEARSAIPALAEAMSNGNPDIRFTLAKALGRIGSEAAVPALAQALQDKDENVRMAAAQALDQLGPDAQAALPVLQKSLRDGNWFVRTHAARAFVRLAAHSESMFPLLLEILNSHDYPREEQLPIEIVIDTFIEMGPAAVSRLFQSIKDDNKASSPFPAIATIIMASRADQTQVVQHLVSALRDPQKAVSDHAARALKWIGAKAALPALLTAPFSEEKQDALETIGRKVILGKTEIPDKLAQEEVRALVAALKHQDWQMRAAGLVVLFSLSDSVSDWRVKIQSCANALKDQDWRVRSTAAAALGLYQNFAAGVNIFKTALNDADARVQQKALEALAHSPHRDDPAVRQALGSLQDNLLKLRHHENQSIRSAALGLITPSDQTFGALLNLLQDKNMDIRITAAEKLIEYGRGRQLAEDSLIQILNHHPDVNIREKAIWALGRSDSPSTVTAKIQALKDKTTSIRLSAVRSLGQAGETAVPALINALQDEDPEVRWSAIYALARVGSPAAVPAITAALNDPDKRVRIKAEQYFSRKKPDPGALQEIAANLHHDDWEVRRAAAEKLRLFSLDPTSVSDPPMPDLLAALQDQHPNVRASVAALLSDRLLVAEDYQELTRDLSAALKQALPSLLVSLKNGDPLARFGAIYTFGKLGPEAQAAIPALRTALQDENWLIRYWAAVALTKINPQETAVVPVFAEIILDPEREELLVQEVYQESEKRDDLAALSKIGSPQSLSVLVHYLRLRGNDVCLVDRQDDDGQTMAADILVKTGPRAIPPLITALKHDNGRFLVADTLGLMGADAIEPLKSLLQPPPQGEPALRGILRDQDADLRRSAVYALGKIGRMKPAKKRRVLRDEPGVGFDQPQEYKSSLIMTLSQIMSDQNETDGVRWMAAASLAIMGQPVDAFFVARNLPNPKRHTCIPFQFSGLFHRFDLYEAKCSLGSLGGGASGPELYQMVRKLLTKTPASASPSPQPQPTVGE